ncbi:sensor histidine kinase [Vibrio paucivorans]|uniref:histidine kinase n=1 Tax=Vibrio paucivorans TaxID=2829489 RepID=A0A9X3CD65_9VIBR|nr:ATP-binding protein [Vibrio paucivorans]MCW8333466.1 ATP-binding protein [Vibrio paucivorans]
MDSNSQPNNSSEQGSHISANALIRRYRLIIYSGLLLIVILTLGNAAYLSKQLKSQAINEETHRALQTLLSLNQTVSVSLTHVDNMRSAVETARGTPELIQAKQTLDYINSQAANSPHGAPWQNLPDKLKNILGQLFIRSNARDLSLDQLALLSMMPAVNVTHQLYPEFQWSYYYDADQAMTQVYPWLGHDVILTATGTSTIDEAINVIYEAGGTFPLDLVNPQANTRRNKVWTTPYMDAGGKGMMVSLLAPIYNQDTFIGAVGTDITLKVLDKILSKAHGHIGRLVLVDNQGLVVGDSEGALKSKTEAVTHEQVFSFVPAGETHTVPQGELQSSANGYWLSYSLDNTPWNLVVELPMSQIRSHILGAILPYLILGGVFALLLLFVVLYQHWSFSQPALQLAKFVEELPKRDPIRVPSIPDKWRYWFESAANTEIARREHLETINKHNQELEQRVAERTQELEKALAQLKATQDELVRSEKLAGLGSLVAGVAHELNTPIGNALMVSTTLKDINKEFVAELEQGLKRSVLDQYIEQSSESADSIERNLHRAAELITSFKQVAVDQSSYQRRQFDLPEILHELRVTMTPNLTRHQIQLEEAFEGAISMDSYPGPLTQVLMNLLSNAVAHAFSEQDTSQKLVTIRCTLTNANTACIKVTDNGCGIEQKHLSKIFDPFFTTRLGQGGSGLGLNIAYNIVTGLLGGDIKASSTLGEGTTFSIELPLNAPDS